MSSRERVRSLEERPSSSSSQALQGQRHGPIMVPHSGTHSLDQLPPIEFLEDKVRSQAAEIDRLVTENRRLAATHGTLRQDLHNTHQEIHKVKVHINSIQTESDIQIRMLLDKIPKLEAKIRTGDVVKADLQKAHKEAQGLVAAREELIGKIQQSNQELRKTSLEAERLPALHEELNRLLQEHHRLRVTFGFEKDRNMEQVRQMQAMEKNLESMARQVEALRAQVMKGDNKVHGGSVNHQQHNPSYQQQIPVSGPYHDGHVRHVAAANSGKVLNRGSSNGSAVRSGGTSYDPSLAPQ